MSLSMQIIAKPQPYPIPKLPTKIFNSGAENFEHATMNKNMIYLIAQISPEKCQFSQSKSLLCSFIILHKSANAFKSATKHEEICIITDSLFFFAFQEIEGRFLFYNRRKLKQVRMFACPHQF